MLNLFVSFSIAAYVGLRAYDVSGREQWEILRYLILDGLKSPLRFLWPNYMRKKNTERKSISSRPNSAYPQLAIRRFRQRAGARGWRTSSPSSIFHPLCVSSRSTRAADGSCCSLSC